MPEPTPRQWKRDGRDADTGQGGIASAALVLKLEDEGRLTVAANQQSVDAGAIGDSVAAIVAGTPVEQLFAR